MDLLKRLVAGLVPEGAALPILAGPLKGSRWLAGSAPGPAKGLSVLAGRSEPGQLAEAARLLASLAPGSDCLDIGAHAGLYSLLFARRARRVYAFEPLPANLAWLARTLARNRVANAVIVPWAVSDAEGPLRFSEGAHSSEGRLDPDGGLPVYATTCDAFCAANGAKPALLKIDVEGAEAAVLRGAAGLLRASRPALLLSTHGDAPKEACFALLRSHGYGAPRPLDRPHAADANEFSISA